MAPLRWGFLSTADINDKILAGARAAAASADVVAVASRSHERAAAYAAERGIPTAHGSYEALLADPQVDAVYISLPNGQHVDWSIRALEAGKHVLCEKPLTRSPAEVERAFAAADGAGRLLMEAFMWRHSPQAAEFARLVRSGAIGELRMIRASFSFMLEEPGNIRLDPALAGGALMDVGCYCVSGARLLAGEPEEAVARQVLAPSGVDIRLAGVLRHANGVLSELHCAFDLPGRHDLEAIGTTGALRAADPWHAVHAGIDLTRADGTTERIAVASADSYGLQLEQFARAVTGAEPPLLGHGDALGQARAIDALYRAAESGRVARVD